ncbi:MAG: type II toxin-antitoxin system RelE/ParE family toxin, partial [Candidatus Binatia bacterium]
ALSCGDFVTALRYGLSVMPAVQLGEKIYVLHAFQKKSKRGIETPKQDVDLIVRRYKEATELAKHEA